MLLHSDTIVEVPGEPSAFRTYDIPKVRLTLPLAGRVRRVRMLLHASLAAITFSGTLVAMMGMVAVLRQPAEPILLVIAVLLVPSLPLGMYFGGMGVTALVDALRPSPVLVIDDTGVRDSRLAAAVRWADVQQIRIEIMQGGVVGVRLRLQAPVPARRNPFRLGALPFRRRLDEAFVSVWALYPRPHLLAHAMTALAERNGSRVIHPSEQFTG